MADLPEVVTYLFGYRDKLEQREKAQLREMAQKWMQVERSLARNIDSLAREIDEARRAGRPISRDKLYRLERYQNLMRQADEQMNRYVNYVDNKTRAERNQYAKLGAEAAYGSVRLAMSKGPASELVSWAALDPARVEAMAIYTSEKSPLTQLLQKTVKEDGIKAMNDALLTAMAEGRGPRQTARMMTKALAVGRDRALVISRDQQLRAHRAAMDGMYTASGIVKAKKRMASKSLRTCIGCLARDGEIIPIDEPSYDHVCGRCVFVPIINGQKEIGWQSGEEWFNTLHPDGQKRLVGPGRYQLLQDGKITFKDLAKTHEHAVWGKSVGIKTLEELKKLPPPRGGGKPKPAPDPDKPKKPRAPRKKKELPPVTEEDLKKALADAGNARAPRVAAAPDRVPTWLEDRNPPTTKAQAYGQLRELESRYWELKVKGKVTAADRVTLARWETQMDYMRIEAKKLPLASGAKIREEINNMTGGYFEKRAKLEARIKAHAEAGNNTTVCVLNGDLKRLNDPRTVRKVKDLLEAEQPLSLTPKITGDGKMSARAQEGIDAFCKMVGNTALPKDMKVNIIVENDWGFRAYYQDISTKVVLGNNSDASTLVHELGHWYEYRNEDWVREHLNTWFERRTKGEQEELLSKLTGISSYDSTEVAKKDKFYNPYVGKIYTRGGKKVALEIMSMGLQRMYDDPLAFIAEDPDYFDLIWGLIR